MLNRSFWKGRRVFLTGHTGFKGSWLSLWLDSAGRRRNRVRARSADPAEPVRAGGGRRLHPFDPRRHSRLPATQGRHGRVPPGSGHSHGGAVGGAARLRGSHRNVFLQRHGDRSPLRGAAAAETTCAVVNVTSDKCYENHEWVWGYREDEPMGGRDPYSNSKGCAELVTAAYRESFFPPESFERHGVALASARAGNAIGGGDWTGNQLIPDLMRAFLAGKPCLIRNPSAIRPWQFVLEPLRGYLMLAERLAEDPGRFASGWNFGPADADAKPVSWIADELVRLWGSRASWSHDGAQHPHEAHFLKLDASKAKAYLGWHPVLPLNQALEWIAEWYRAFQAGADLERFTRMQIERYEMLATAASLCTAPVEQ